MPTPGMIATDMQQALRDLETALGELASMFGLEPYVAPQVRHPDRAYLDMVRTRALADWLQTAVKAMATASSHTAPDEAVKRVLSRLTKAQLVELAADLGVEVDDGQRKDDIIGTVAAWAAGA